MPLASKFPPDCQRWLADVNEIMKRDWFIDLHDAGAGDDDIARYHSWGDDPEAFVSWFAEKYDLIDFRS